MAWRLTNKLTNQPTNVILLLPFIFYLNFTVLYLVYPTLLYITLFYFNYFTYFAFTLPQYLLVSDFRLNRIVATLSSLRYLRTITPDVRRRLSS